MTVFFALHSTRPLASADPAGIRAQLRRSQSPRVVFNAGLFCLTLSGIPVFAQVAAPMAVPPTSPSAAASPGDGVTPVAAPASTDRSRMLAILNLPTPPRPNKNRNHDEAKATLFPNLPDPLVLKNGQPVKDADTWWKQRRPEIFNDMMAEVYGRIPDNTPKITWEIAAETDNGTMKTRNIVGHIDNSSYPAARPTIQLTLYLPSHTSGPVPVIVEVGGMFGAPRAGGPPRGAPAGAGANTPAGATPANGPTGPAATAAAGSAVRGPGPGAGGGRDQVLARGWGFAVFNTGAVQADSAAGLTSGIIGLVNKGQPRSRTDEWGVLAAWAWGLSKTADYLATDRDVDAIQLGLEGFSRWGKTAVLAAAIEPRWVVAWAGNSGAGGVKLNRRDYGESLDDVAEENESYWMAGNYLKYANHYWGDLPVDSHELVALVAPRAVFITGGTTDQNSDANGMFLAGVGAGPVYRLLGKQDLGATEMPAPDVALLSGDLGFREHVGPHTQAPDWPSFLEFAAKYLHAPTPN